MSAHHILIIEDDPVIQTELETLLQSQGYSTRMATDGSDLPLIFQSQNPPQLVLLDIKLPSADGFYICSQIRSISDIPIIFVTSCASDMNELKSIMLGGDAFMTKPYHRAILLAKIDALLRKSDSANTSQALTYRNATLHLARGNIEYQGKSMDLTKNELKILSYLFKNAGKICYRNDMLDYLWDNHLYIDDNALSVNITRIRNKLNDIGLHQFIKTKHGQGYTL